MIWLLVACAGPRCEVDGDGARPTWSNYGEAFFTTWCDACHAAGSPNRFGAPEGLTFDDEAEVLGWSDEIRSSAVDGDSMPLGGGLESWERDELGRYLDCLEAR